MIKESKIQVLERYLFMIIGCICYASSLRMFLIPNEVVSGGVSGAASLIEILTGIDASIFMALINIPILLLGLKLMGLKFSVRCVITTGTLSLCTYLLNFIDIGDITDDSMLASLYGGILQGIGVGLFIKYEMSSGGTELLGRITNHFVPIGTIAFHTAVFDGSVVVLGAFLLKNPENVLYALILIFTSAKVSDLFVMGFEKSKLCFIITNKEEEIAEYMLQHSPRGITLINGEGMYSKQHKGILLTCVRAKQIAQLKMSVNSIDKSAFVIMCDANQVFGKGFKTITK